MRRQRGFTLLEVIVAFALLALALTLLLGSLSGASRQVRMADDASRAALHAQSLLSQVGVGTVLRPGRQQGDLENGRFQWTLEVQPFVDPAIAQTPVRDPSAPEMMQLRLVVSWGERPRERIVWDSLRLVPPDPERGRVMQ